MKGVMFCECTCVFYSFPRWMLRPLGTPSRRGYKKQSKGILAYQWLKCRWQPNLNLSRKLDDHRYTSAIAIEFLRKGVQGFSPAGVQGASPWLPLFPKRFVENALRNS